MSSATLCPRRTAAADHTTSPQHRDGKFRNVVPRQSPGFLKTLGIAWRVLTSKPDTTVPRAPIPVQALSAAALADAPDASLFRLGHSTLLLKLAGEFWLTDPVFSERASPVQWAGPKRFHAPPIDIDGLPPIKGVILSHDHFDHLDHDAILQLAPKVEVFVTPLGVGDRLTAWGIDAAKVRQLDWWQQTSVHGVQLVATPAQHFSGRSLRDGDSTLWASWVIVAGDLRLFFSGDTGYHADFKTIGDRFGPFDVTLLETGAYDQQWPEVHMQPEETLQAHLDLRGRWLMPVHNGTFDLAMHPWHEPFDRILDLAAAHGVRLATPEMGERLSLDAPHPGQRWWTAV
ncbi:MBL fold metallo-hydrolase [Rhizobacter sp. SG703]|uniref:MBL fold metallo-hydrolase n=1 Tax=Rhizobacter sp. SG703 TaxID=2587140 RepID=UPI0014454600|nr:MBL fold metallo-hydrolase [Rhizobacter sp. SG703]NKI94462.1 L-ascorbate metabolism protein UlaG (beta-lactamase superfamily) [Rhizobacter sp. SG703]